MRRARQLHRLTQALQSPPARDYVSLTTPTFAKPRGDFRSGPNLALRGCVTERFTQLGFFLGAPAQASFMTTPLLALTLDGFDALGTVLVITPPQHADPATRAANQACRLVA